MALALLGAQSIYSVNDQNKRAKMADRFYDMSRDYLLTRFDWPFARKIAQIQPVAEGEIDLPTGNYAYKLPADCRAPRDFYPPGSDDYWYVISDYFVCLIPGGSQDIFITYTAQEVDNAKFSDTFSELLSVLLAVKMCPAITQDKELFKSLYGQYIQESRDCWESDANIGNMYREHDEDPEEDTFVNPDKVRHTRFNEFVTQQG